MCDFFTFFYLKVREYCGLPSISSFSELNNTIDDDIIKLLESVYSHHDDIDLVVGGLSERPLSGAVVGPTFGCLLGQQFQILKKGDRFEHRNYRPVALLSILSFCFTPWSPLQVWTRRHPFVCVRNIFNQMKQTILP